MDVSEPSGTETSQPAPQAAVTNPLLPGMAAVLAWLVPGAGHLFLKRGRRAVLFFVLVLAFVYLFGSRIPLMEDWYFIDFLTLRTPLTFNSFWVCSPWANTLDQIRIYPDNRPYEITISEIVLLLPDP